MFFKKKKTEDRKAYIDKMAAQLKEWDDKIQELEEKARTTKAEASSELSQRIEDLRKRRKAAQDKLKELREASEDAWKDIRKGAQKSWKEMQKALDRAKSKFD